MTHLKGFNRTADPDQMASGELHEPDLARIAQLLEVEKTPNVEIQLTALKLGVPVVASEYAGEIPRTRRFEVYPDKTIEESRSAHGVGFGRFVGWLPGKRRGSVEEESLLRVAVKPFTTPETALHEMHGYRTLGKLGVETFAPVGVFPALKGDHFIGMTLTRKDLTSLDRDIWVPGRRVTSEATEEIAQRNALTVVDIARLSAFLNARGIFLPDGQIKNWAITPSGKTGAIDTENIMQLPLGHESAPQQAWECIEKLTKSLILDTKDVDAKMFGVGMFAGMTLEHVRENIEELIIIPYIEELELMLGGETSQGQRDQIQLLYEGIVERFYSEKSWPNHIVASQHAKYRRTA